MSEDVSAPMMRVEYKARRSAIVREMKAVREKIQIVQDEGYTQLSANGLALLAQQEERLIAELTSLYRLWDLQCKTNTSRR